MKKIRNNVWSAVLTAALLSLSQHPAAQTITKSDDLMTATEGWDIYKAGTYRYGQCFIKNDEGRSDAGLEASGST